MNLNDLNYKLSESQIKSFQNKGHILLRSLSNASELSFYQPRIKEASQKYRTEFREIEKRDTYGKAFLQIMNLWQQDQFVKQFIMAKRFANVAAQLLKVENVRLYHDQALFKEPQGGYTPWHQDQYYWPLETEKTITMWMPLVDITEDMGMLTFASSSHVHGELLNNSISDNTEIFFQYFIDKNNIDTEKATFMKAGDATFHLGWTIHGAGPNKSQFRTREIMTVIYYADGTKISKPKNRHQEKDLQKWLGGIKPGELANSKLNPLML